MIKLKSAREIELMRKAGRIAACALKLAGQMVRPGATTLSIDEAVSDYIRSHGAEPSFLGYNGFPASACISINSQVIHGIPSRDTVIRDGDIVSVDVGAFFQGYHGDCAETFLTPSASEKASRLVRYTRESFFEAMKVAKPGFRVTDISCAVQRHCESGGFSVVRTFVGHGVGMKLHEDPEVPNFGPPGRGARLIPGMTIAVEPMVNEGAFEVSVLGDGWTVVTADGSLSAHYENTVLITSAEPEILTIAEEN